MKQRRIAVFVQGPERMTRVTYSHENTKRGWDAMALATAKKKPSRVYQVYEVNDNDQRRGDPLASWYVGEGFSHAEGWWVEYS
jgi:hypothetical protein